MKGLPSEDVLLAVVQELSTAGLVGMPVTYEVNVGRGTPAYVAVTEHGNEEVPDQLCVFERRSDHYLVRMSKGLPADDLFLKEVCVERVIVFDSTHGEPEKRKVTVTEANVASPNMLRRLVRDIIKWFGPPRHCRDHPDRLIELGLLDSQRV